MTSCFSAENDLLQLDWLSQWIISTLHDRSSGLKHALQSNLTDDTDQLIDHIGDLTIVLNWGSRLILTEGSIMFHNWEISTGYAEVHEPRSQWMGRLKNAEERSTGPIPTLGDLIQIDGLPPFPDVHISDPLYRSNRGIAFFDETSVCAKTLNQLLS